MLANSKRKTGGLRLKKRASESHRGEDGQTGSSKGPPNLDNFKPMACMSDHTSIDRFHAISAAERIKVARLLLWMQLYSLLLQPHAQLSNNLPPLPPSKLVKYADENSVSPEYPHSSKLVWTSLPLPNMQLLTRKPPKFLSMEELCCGPAADLIKRGPIREQPQHQIDSSVDQGGLDTHSPLPPVQKAVVTVVGGATTGASLAGSSGEEPGGYGSDLDLFEDEEFDRLCQDVELVCEGSSSDSSLPVVDLTPKVVEQPLQARTVKQPLQAKVIERPHRTAKRTDSDVSRCPLVHHGQSKARVLTPEICPMCSIKFPHRFTEVDVEQHIAACLAGDLKDFDDDDDDVIMIQRNKSVVIDWCYTR